jgi:hypothetical protein
MLNHLIPGNAEEGAVKPAVSGKRILGARGTGSAERREDLASPTIQVLVAEVVDDAAGWVQ